MGLLDNLLSHHRVVDVGGSVFEHVDQGASPLANGVKFNAPTQNVGTSGENFLSYDGVNQYSILPRSAIDAMAVDWSYAYRFKTITALSTSAYPAGMTRTAGGDSYAGIRGSGTANVVQVMVRENTLTITTGDTGTDPLLYNGTERIVTVSHDATAQTITVKELTLGLSDVLSTVGLGITTVDRLGLAAYTRPSVSNYTDIDISWVGQWDRVLVAQDETDLNALAWPFVVSREITNIDGDNDVQAGQTGVTINVIGLDLNPTTKTVMLNGVALPITFWGALSQVIAGSDPYTIAGTGFGTKTGTPYYNDFETEAAGQVAANIGELIVGGSSGYGGVTISNTDSNSGTKCINKDYSNGGFPEIYKALSGLNTRVYMACFIKFSGTGGAVWKHGRLGSNTPYSGTPRAVSSFTGGSSTLPQTFSGEINNSAGLTTWSAHNTSATAPNTAYIASKWQFYEMEFFAGTVDGNDSYFYETVDGVKTVIWENRPYLTTANSDLPDWAMTALAGHDGTNTLTMLMDDVYVDESRARVVMTDSAIYANATKWAVQPIVSYSDTEIATTPKRQGFSVGETAYLHVFNNDGTLVNSGSSFTVTENL